MPYNSTNDLSGSRSIALNLCDIASWHDIPGITARSAVRASVPVLQRGLVWNPAQIELLWDSLFRGFPIGSLVLSAPIKTQTKDQDRLVSGITHHLLDGQQRCDAIALGFKDPFLAPKPANERSTPSILWLDLDPAPDQWSTREYVFRLTTVSHPWGYTRADGTHPLAARDIRKALERIIRHPSDENYERPHPVELCPQEAGVPVPLSWLLQSSDLRNPWESIRARLSDQPELPWHAQLLTFLESSEKAPQRKLVVEALGRIVNAQLIALCAPVDLVNGSRQETEVGAQRENISNIEHLFQRLNQQGTRLDGEELAYSMIKAYWPELAGPIDKIDKPMPATRLISLGLRAALAREGTERLPSALGVSQIRKLAAKQDEQTAHVRDYIRTDLAKRCQQLNDWLRYEPALNQGGLMPVHIASIARESADMYLLLLTMAERTKTAWEIPESDRARCLVALVTVVHWFGRDKAAIANRLFAACGESISLDNIRKALAGSQAEEWLRPVHSPEAVEAFFEGLTEEHRLNWNWWHFGQPDMPEGERQKIWNQWGEFLWFRNQQEMLLYAQRHFVHRQFKRYDPSRKDLWAGHNRPWDFDHILASAYIHGKQGPHKNLCREWLGTVGNFRAWPMEDNRSEQAQTANEKLSRAENQRKRQDSFIEEDELIAFSHGHDTRKVAEYATAFTEACRKRMLRIYRDWYEALEVGKLIVADTAEPTLSVPTATLQFNDSPETA